MKLNIDQKDKKKENDKIEDKSKNQDSVIPIVIPIPIGGGGISGDDPDKESVNHDKNPRGKGFISFPIDDYLPHIPKGKDVSGGGSGDGQAKPNGNNSDQPTGESGIPLFGGGSPGVPKDIDAKDQFGNGRNVKPSFKCDFGVNIGLGIAEDKLAKEKENRDNDKDKYQANIDY